MVEKNSLGQITNFFKIAGMPLTTLSIFLFFFLEIIKANFIDTGSNIYTIFLALLLGLVFLISFFIYRLAQNFKYKLINFFGWIVIALPFLFYAILQKEIKANLLTGSYVLCLLFATFITIWGTKFLFSKLESLCSSKKSKLYLYTFSFLVSLIILALSVYTDLSKLVYTYSNNYFDGLFEAIILGFELGLHFSLIAIPAVFILDKVSNFIEHQRKKN